MLSKELSDLLWLYARRGIADWRQAPSMLRKRATECLGAEIADNESEAAITLHTIYNGKNAKQLRFIPMPRHPKRPGFERSFFIPVCQAKKETITVGFDLFLIVNAATKNCLAYRFEPAHDLPSVHNYGHVQMTQKLLLKTIPSKTIDWIPVSYPAYPLYSSDPLRMFLSMATAVHGYNNGILHVIQEVFVEVSRAREVGVYVNHLSQMLS